MKHTSNIPILDQGNLGSCTGNAATANLSYDLFWTTSGVAVLSPTDAASDEDYAVDVYSSATSLDPYEGQWPPNDTGSDGLSVAKVLKNRGLISGYQHATSLLAVLTALQTQAVIVGTEWRKDMFDPDDEGRLHVTGSAEGGHEYVLDEIDVENKRVWMRNSWGANWGLNGRAWFTWDDFESLLQAEGDCTVFVPANEPPPMPQYDDADEALARVVRTWLDRCSIFHPRLRRALKVWLAAKGL